MQGSGVGVKGLQDVVQGLRRSDPGRDLSASLKEIGEPSGQFDWRRLASLGTHFVCGWTCYDPWRRACVHSARMLSSLSSRGVALTHGKWYYEVVVVARGRGPWAGLTLITTVMLELAVEWAMIAIRGVDGPGVSRHRGVEESWGAVWAAGDVIGCFADLENGRLYSRAMALSTIWVSHLPEL